VIFKKYIKLVSLLMKRFNKLFNKNNCTDKDLIRLKSQLVLILKKI